MTLPAIRRRSDVDVFSSSDLHLSRLSSSRFLSLSRSPFFSIRARIPRVDRPSTSSSLTPIDRPTPPRSPEFHPLLSFPRVTFSLSLSLPPRVPIIDAKTSVSSPHPFLSIPSVHVFPCAHSSHIAPFFLFLSYTSPLHTFRFFSRPRFCPSLSLSPLLLPFVLLLIQ